MEKSEAGKHHPYSILAAKAALVIMFAAAVFFVMRYYISEAIEKKQAAERMQHAQHYQIDEIGDAKIYIEIYNGDTVGVFVLSK